MATEPKFKRLTVEQIKAIARMWMDEKQTMTAVCDKLNVTPSQVRSAIGGLKKHDVAFPEHERETSSKYADIASEMTKSAGKK